MFGGAPAGVSQLKAGAALSYILIGLGLVIAMVYTPIVLRLLGQNEYGLYSLVLSIVGYLSLLSFGLNSAYVRFHARFRKAKDDLALAQLNAMFVLVLGALGIVVLFVGWLLVSHSSAILGDSVAGSQIGTGRVLFAIMSGSVAISFPLAVFESHVIAAERFVFQKVLALARTLLVPLVVLPLLLSGHGSVGMAGGTAVVSLCVQLYTAVFCFKTLRMKFVFNGMRLALLGETVVFSSYIFAGALVDQINWNVDKYIVGWFWGTSSVAIYSVASLLNMYYMSLSSAVSDVFVPRVHQMVATEAGDRALTQLFTRVGRIQFVLLAGVLVEFVIFGKYFVTLWAGQEYDQSYAIALLLMIPAAIPLIQNVGIEIQRAKNIHRFRSLLYLFIAVVNIAISLLLVRELGPIGAAYGTAGALLLGNGLIMNWYYSARVGLDMRHFWSQVGRLVPATIPPVLLGVVLLASQDLGRPLTLAAAIALVAVAYGASMWLLGLNESEKELVRAPLRSVLRKRR